MDLTGDLTDRLKHTCSEASAEIRQAASRSAEAVKEAVEYRTGQVQNASRVEHEHISRNTSDMRRSVEEAGTELKELSASVRGLDTQMHALKETVDQVRSKTAYTS